MLVLGTLLLSLAAPALAEAPEPCEVQPTAIAFDASLREAEDAFRALDVQRFTLAAGIVRASLPCVAERLTPRLAARLHRLRGVEAFLNEQRVEATSAFAAARSADPSLSMDLVPEGHALELLYGEARLSEDTYPLDPPDAGELFLDGGATLSRPADRPVVAQWMVDDAPRFTVLAGADEALPAYPIAPDRGPTADARRRAKRRKVGLVILGTGAATAGVAAALHGGAAASRASFNAQHPEWDRDDLLRVKQRTNSLGTAAGVVGASALALGGLGVVLQW